MSGDRDTMISALGTSALGTSAWADAMLAARLFAVDPAGTGGVALRSLPGPVRDIWLGCLQALLAPSTPLRRLPIHAAESRILGGLDLAATLNAGRPIAERGILAESDGGVVIMAMAERQTPSTAAPILAALDSGERVLERDGISLRCPARIGVIALDEGIEVEERPPACLLDRLAFLADLNGIALRAAAIPPSEGDTVAAARALLPSVEAEDEILRTLCAAAMALGIASYRAPILALRVARAFAALEGRIAVTTEDAAVAARLVLVPRADALPALPENAEADSGDSQPPGETPDPTPDDRPEGNDGADREETAAASDTAPPDDIVLAAAAAILPEDVMARLRLPDKGLGRAGPAGRSGELQKAVQRGRPVGVRRGAARGGARLNVLETLRAAAPWQPLRRSARSTGARHAIEIRSEDFRITRFKQHSETMTIFVVDASGSAALHRLGEAKGAVELLLADCYVRRDQVALIAFRGSGADILLPPTRSLVRAKRCLASLPGGGGTPLAAGITAAAALVDAARRKGQSAIAVFLTDGRANIALDGGAGRQRAEEDAIAASRRIRAGGGAALLVDTSPRERPQAHRIAAEMGGAYLPLPYADAATLSRAVQATVGP